MKVWRPFLVILVFYTRFLAGTLSWHLLYTGRPIHSTAGGMLLAYATSTALIGLFSLVGALAAIRYLTAIALAIFSSAILVKLWMVFEERHIVWEITALLYEQLTLLVIGLSAFRWRGRMLSQSHSTSGQKATGTRFAIRDLLLLTGAIAVLFAVLGSSDPSFSTIEMQFVLLSAGAFAALVAAAAAWLCLGTRAFWLRLATCVLVAPIGGLVNVIAFALLGPGRHNWQWFAGVTATQMVLMVIPLAVMRLQGFRFVRCA